MELASCSVKPADRVADSQSWATVFLNQYRRLQMAHLFRIGGITPENDHAVMAGMLLMGSMQQLTAEDEGIYLFISNSSDHHEKVAVRVYQAIEGAGATVLSD